MYHELFFKDGEHRYLAEGHFTSALRQATPTGILSLK